MQAVGQLKDYLTILLIWIVVPLVLFGVLVLAHSIVQHSAEGEHRLSVRAGYWTGLILFVAFVVFQIDSFQIPDFTKPVNVHLGIVEFAILMCGGGAGFLLLYLIERRIPVRLAGFMVLGLVFAGSSFLFSYFFIQTFNDILLPFSLGLAAGILIHVVMFPKHVHEIFAKPGP